MPSLVVAGATIDHDGRAGDGPALVLVHDGMCDRRDWDRLLPELPPQRALLRLDLRAHGRSTGDAADLTIPRLAADLIALVSSLASEGAILVGHSLGARVVCEAAAQAPDKVAGLVLVDGSHTHGLAATVPSDQLPTGLDAILDATIGPYLDPPERARVQATMRAAPADIMAACVTAMREWDLARADTVYFSLVCPVLAIQSTWHDAASPRRSFPGPEESSPYLDFLRAAVPELAVDVVPQAGHFLQLEQPALLAARIEAFAKALGRGF